MAKAKCKMCGCCCYPVICCTKKKEMGGRKGSPFTMEHWHRISKEEALKRNPNLKYLSWKSCYYECDMFDVESRKCLAHSDPNRPYACTEYPKYILKDGSKIHLELYPECGYK